MSSPKFATMTASLLARKGDATPSVLTPSVRSAHATLSETLPIPQNDAGPRPFAAVQQTHALPAAPVPAVEDVDKPRRIMILIAHGELERLGIAAIKKGVTRHDIVRAALDSYFQKLAAELPQSCNCMANGPCCR